MAGAPIISMALYGERYEDDWFAAENSADFLHYPRLYRPFQFLASCYSQKQRDNHETISKRNIISARAARFLFFVNSVEETELTHVIGKAKNQLCAGLSSSSM